MPLFLFVGEMALFIAFLFSFVAVGATRGISADPIGSTISYQIQWVMAQGTRRDPMTISGSRATLQLSERFTRVAPALAQGHDVA